MSYDVSVLIPAYNMELTVARAVRSVLQQTGINAEAVVCDDGSTDGTGDILDALATEHDNVQLIGKPNGGVVSALNAAGELATGRYRMILAADDWLQPGALAGLLDTLESDPGARFAYGSVKYWGRRNDIFRPLPFDAAQFYRHFASLYPVLWHADAWAQGCRFMEDERGLADWGFVLQLIDKLGWTGVAVPDVLVLHYVLTDTGMSATIDDDLQRLEALRQKYPKLEAVAV